MQDLKYSNKFFKFRGCLEAASEHTNVPPSSACTWTPLHHPSCLSLLIWDSNLRLTTGTGRESTVNVTLSFVKH